MRTTPLLRPIVVLLLAAVCTMAIAQNKYWIGGNGSWSDPANWSTSANGPGGAGIPRVGENVQIAPVGNITISFSEVAWCRDLVIDGTSGSIVLLGDPELNISGSWIMKGAVQWDRTGVNVLIGEHGGSDLDLRGIPIHGDILFNGSGSWSMISDLFLAEGNEVILKEGTLIGNENLLKADALQFHRSGQKQFIASDGVIMLDQRPEQAQLDAFVQPGNSTLAVAGSLSEWNIPAATPAGSRDVNVCGTGPGQLPFVINAQLVSNYNGYGVSCRGICNGSVTVTVNGGVGPFSYQWLNSGPPSATWNSACGGPQIVIVTDLGQGISCPASVNVTEPAPLGVIFFGQGTPPTCADVCDGTRTALAVGGVSPHAYDWNNGAGSSSSFNQLCAGLNTLLITDANNCTFDTTFFFNIQPIVPNLTFTGASCYNECDGVAGVAPSGGTGSFNITWTPAPPVGQNTNSVSGLCAGNWSVTIADGNGCDTTVTFIIDQPPPITASVASVDATCAGGCDGTATVTVNGIGPYAFAWDPTPGAGQGTAAVSGLCSGTYTVVVTDQTSGCDTLLTVSIDDPAPFSVGSEVTDASCSNSCDGSIGLSTTGASPAYTYLWDPPPPLGQGTSSISGLCPGSWQVLITDALGCDTTMTFSLNAPLPLDPGFTSTDINCAGDCDGAASASVSGGTPGYTYLWTPAPPTGQGTADATGLCAGAYQLLITDANGCDTLIAFQINEPLPLQLDPTQTDISCSGACDGSASVEANGGVPGYTYTWSPEPPTGQGTAAVSDLCPGIWEVIVADANGCEITAQFDIEDADPVVIDLQVQPASCPGECDGTASVMASGGSPGYSYFWSPEPGAGQGTTNATGLCPQEWSVTITDALGCDSTITFSIDAPEPIIANGIVNDATCGDLCNGSIALAPSGGNGTYTYLWSPLPPVGQGTTTVSGLCAGNWDVTITSGACDTTITFVIAAPLPINAVIDVSDVTCPGECDGSVSAVVDGGTAPYSYTWTPPPGGGQGTENAIGLCPGSYALLIVDDAGCDTTISFVINEPGAITGSIQISEASCGAACDGSATIAASGGTAPYEYTWGPGTITGQGTVTASDLCPGAYEVTVTDAVGCSGLFTVLIDTPIGVEVIATVVDPSCANSCDGSIATTSTGGLPPYTYTWSPEPANGQGTATVSGLCAGTWILQVTDALGCDTLLSFDLIAPDAIIPNEVWTNETCNGPCDGTASVAPTGGVGPFTYFWAPAPPIGQNSAAVSGLCPGEWSVLITDSEGCDTTVVIQVLDQQPIQVDLSIEDASCSGDCTGSASVTPSGGVDPYSFAWSPVPPIGQGTATVEGLCVGVWQVEVTDALGCDTIINFNIGSPAPFDIDLVIEDENCSGPCSGSASVTITGGAGSETFFWQPEPISGQGTSMITGLCSGNGYSLQITDINGCDTVLTFSIDPFDQVLANLSTADVTCADACDASVTAAPTGGVAPYTFTWTPAPVSGQGTSQAAGFCAGEVSVQIIDATGCIIVDTISVSAPGPLADNAVVTDATCHDQCNGTITVAPSGGVPPYDVYWSPVPQEGQGSLTATGLCMGTYLVQIVDANGCDVIFSHEVFKPSEIGLSIVTSPSECQQCIGAASVSITGGTPGYSIEWIDPLGNVIGTTDSIQNMCAGLYVLHVTDANGCEISQAVPIIDPDSEQVTPVDGVTSCPTTCDGTAAVGFTCSDPPCVIAWSDDQGQALAGGGTELDQLCEGSYFATVTNASGCVAIVQVDVTVPDDLIASVNTTPASCPFECDGAANISIAGGQPPFVITWDPAPPTGQGSTIASGLCAGTYDVEILDGNGCITALSVVVSEPQLLTSNAVITNVSCFGTCDGSIAPSITGGEPPYFYSWTPTITVGVDGEATDLCAGNYQLIVTDANGCSITEVYSIIGSDELQLAVSSTPSACPDCEGTATVAITGGTAPFDVQWNYQNTVVGTTESLTDLCSGLYVVSVTDANGCSGTINVVVPDPNAEVLSPVDGQVACANDCNGSVGVDLNCAQPPCTSIWTDDDGNVIAQDVFQVGGLCIGDYTVQVTNAGGCTSVAVASVVPTQLLIPNITSSPLGCPGACDASASVAPAGGVEPYSFLWSPEPGGGQGTSLVTGLCSGTYEVIIADASGCDTTVTVVIADPQPITIASVVSDLVCSGSCDASIDAFVSGGAPPYTFFWSPEPAIGQGTSSAEGLCEGTYSLTVTDAGGCTSSASWTLAPADPIVLTTTFSLSECGACSGGVNATVSGGVPPYAYAWSAGGNIFGTDPQVNGLCAGLYSILVSDANGCQASQLVPVSDVEGEILTVSGSTTSCVGVCDGTASVNFTCTQPDCSIDWFNSIGDTISQDMPSVSALCAGSYYVMVTNAVGCVSIDVAVVNDPDPIVPNLTVTPTICAGDCNGTATVTPAGGTGNYSYNWQPEPGSGQGTSQATGLCEGAYEVTITDDSGCSIPVPVTITAPASISASSTVSPIGCNAACDGVIDLDVTGGTVPYDIVWTPVPPNGQGGLQASGLCAGIWSFTVTDGNGCTSNGSIELLDPSIIDLQLTTSNDPCSGSCQGTAGIVVTGGVPPYDVVWTDSIGVIAQDVNGVLDLCAGPYEVSVTDAHGCTVDVPFTIDAPDPIDAGLTFTNETCNGPCDGTATVAPTGGSGGGYTFTWQPEPATGQGTDQVTGLCAGNWSVLIADGSGCDTTIAFTIQPYAPIDATALIGDVQCNGGCDGTVDLTVIGGGSGFLYLWTPEPGSGQGTSSVSQLCAGAYSVLITDPAGCDTTLVLTVTEPDAIAISVDQVQPASCATAADGSISITISGGSPTYALQWTGPDTFTSADEDLQGLLPGTYSLAITDANGCVRDTSIVVDALEAVEADAGGDQQICSGITVLLDGSLSTGGTSYQWLDPQGNEIATDATTTVGPLSAGNHLFTLVVSNGPCMATDEVVLVVLDDPIADAGPDQTIYVNGSATLGGDPTGPIGSTFVWSPDSVLTNANIANPVADPLMTTWFSVTVTAPSGCITTDSVLITVIPNVVIPTGFTPNGDGWNDTWVIDFIELFPKSEVEIYNRWGEQLFRSVGYKQPWDGRYSGGFVPVGTYYYVIKLNDAEFPDPYTGPLTVIR